VYRRDLDWLSCCDVLIAEASGSSHGVGFEVGYVIGRARDTTRPWNGCGPKPSVASLIERFLMDTSNRMALLRMSSFVTASICPRRSNFRRSFPPGQVRGVEMYPLEKRWRRNARQTRGRRLLVTRRGFIEGETPEGTPQRLCPPSPVLSKHDALSSTKSFGMLASRMR